jgi:hypothetical protein
MPLEVERQVVHRRIARPFQLPLDAEDLSLEKGRSCSIARAADLQRTVGRRQLEPGPIRLERDRRDIDGGERVAVDDNGQHAPGRKRLSFDDCSNRPPSAWTVPHRAPSATTRRARVIILSSMAMIGSGGGGRQRPPEGVGDRAQGTQVWSPTVAGSLRRQRPPDLCQIKKSLPSTSPSVSKSATAEFEWTILKPSRDRRATASEHRPPIASPKSLPLDTSIPCTSVRNAADGPALW